MTGTDITGKKYLEHVQRIENSWISRQFNCTIMGLRNIVRQMRNTLFML